MSLQAAIGCALAAPAAAQVGRGAFVGHVADQNGAAVPGASVTLVAAGTGLTRNAITDQSGDYSVPGLPSGSYQIRIQLAGFRPLTREGVRIATGETVRVDLQLE